MNPVVSAARARLPHSRVGIVYGGTSSEHEVSRASGEAVAAAAAQLGHTVVRCEIGTDGGWLAGSRPGLDEALEALVGCDVVVPALHGRGGEDGTIQGLLRTIGVPFVGSGVAASAVGMDKRLTKLVLAAHGIEVAAGLTVRGGERVDAAALAAAGLAFPLFVKPVDGGSSHGVARVTGPRSLRSAVEAAARLASRVLIEPEIVGREIDVAVIELPDGTLHTAPPLEIHSDPDRPFFDTAAKYASPATRFEVPAPLTPEEDRRLQAAAVAAFEGLGCRGLARVDFFLTEAGRPVLNEVNTFPGFTPASQFPRMWAAAGLDHPGIVNVLLRTALDRYRG